MNDHHKKAWEYLTQLEQNSLYLQVDKGLSTWEIGEVLGVTHYKYIELKDRAQKFLNLFSEFFESYPSLFSANPPVEEVFRDYIEGCIEKRLKKEKAIEFSGDSSMILPEISGKKIIRNMEYLNNSKEPWDNAIYELIHEFDRWNNFRILPRKIQRPSAYKRRNNKRDKLYMKYICNLPEKKLKALIDIYWYAPVRKKAKYYMALISEDLFEDGYCIIPVKAKPKQLEELSKLYIYLFEDEIHADMFGYQVSRYKTNIKGPAKGFQFWREYRDNIQRAINYNLVNNLDFYAEKLDMAYNIKSRKRKDPKPKSQKGATRANPGIFY